MCSLFNNGYNTKRSASGMETSEKVGAKTLGLRPPQLFFWKLEPSSLPLIHSFATWVGYYLVK